MAERGHAVAVLDPVDQRGRDLLAAVHDGGVGGHHAHERGLPRADRHGELAGQVIHDPEPLGVGGDLLHADRLGQAHGHEVAGLLDAEAHRARPVELVRVVGRLPLALPRALLDHEGRIENAGGRGETVVEGCHVDHRLERGARLAPGLGRAVELTGLEIEPAGHRQDTARVRVDRHDRAVDVGNLLEAEAALGIGVRVGVLRDGGDQHHVPRREDRVSGLDRGAALLFRAPFPRPAQLRERDHARGAVDEADARAAGLDIDHRGEPPVPGSGRHLDVREGRRPGGRILQARDRPPPAMAAVVGDEPVAQGLLGDPLQPGIERRAHREPSLVQRAVAEPLDQLAPHLFREVGRFHERVPVPPNHVDRALAQFFGLGREDRTIVGHAAEHIVSARDGGSVVAQRIVVVRRLGKRGQEGRLVHGQLVERLPEIVQRRRRNAVGAEAEIDFVEVELEDLVLAERALHPEGQDRLAHLALDGHILGEQEILRDLLGDRRSALGTAAAADVAHVRHRGTHDTQQIDARVRVEVLVLGREKRVLDELRHGGDRHEHTALHGVFGQQAAVTGMHARRDRRLVVGELAVVRQIPAVLPEHPQHAAHGQQDADKRQTREISKPAKHSGFPDHSRPSIDERGPSISI